MQTERRETGELQPGDYIKYGGRQRWIRIDSPAKPLARHPGAFMVMAMWNTGESGGLSLYGETVEAAPRGEIPDAFSARTLWRLAAADCAESDRFRAQAQARTRLARQAEAASTTEVSGLI